MKLSFIHKLLIISGVFIIGVIMIGCAFFMILVNPNPLMVGNWDVSEESFGDVPTPFANDAEHFTFYANDTVQVIDADHDSEWFTYELILPRGDFTGEILFEQGENIWIFEYYYNMTVMDLTSLSCPACAFSMVRLF